MGETDFIVDVNTSTSLKEQLTKSNLQHATSQPMTFDCINCINNAKERYNVNITNTKK